MARHLIKLTPEYLLNRVEFELNSGCWLWSRAADCHGYGSFGQNGRTVKAHRATYEIFVGPIPAGGHILHRCDTPACVNPAHLRVGGPKENADDREARKRGNHAIEERHPRAKLNAALVRKVRARVAAGESVRAIGREIGMGHSALNNMLHGRTWRNV